MSQTKVQQTHLKRKAVVYVRQSSLQQVEQNVESQKRQYQLAERVRSLGWDNAQCVVIDDDLGISGAQSYNRPGYQRLTAMIALREVGIVLGLEVSRLARNSLDWYQLLELAAAFDVLIADEDGVYDPAEFNDRLLLSLKGTISEVELYQIRMRLLRGRLNKAQRGELKVNLPVGLDWNPTSNKPRLAVDERVQHAVALVFHLFRQLRSIHSVLNYLRREGLELPCQRLRRMGREIGWRRPSRDALRAILTNPAYAGVYCYGRKQKLVDPIKQTTHVRNRPRSEWLVFIPDHYPGYIRLAEFEENQRILQNNRSQSQNQGAVRRGPTLLQGLTYCKRCGRKMRVCYSRGRPYYICDATHQRYGDPVCNRAGARRVDGLVEELLLTVLHAKTLELSLSYDEKLHQEARLLDRSWQEKLKYLEYEADLAHRRYEMVDPENRLVADTLEREWEQRLVVWETYQREYEAQRPGMYELGCTMEQIEQVVTHLQDYWYAESFLVQDKKELLRCLIEYVFLENCGQVIRAQVNWYGGAISELEVPKYIFSSPRVYYRIRDLARAHTDAEIATMLNQEGIKTFRGKSWTNTRVMDFRLSNRIPSCFTTSAELRNPDSEHITSAEVAARLDVSQTTVRKWYKLGILSGKQDHRQARLWIRWTKDVMYRLGGDAALDPRMVSIRSLCRAQGKGLDEVLAWTQANGHAVYRLRRGSKLLYYVLPGEPEVSLYG